METNPSKDGARRAPDPGSRQRDAERTRAALLDAGLAEFSAKGIAGARVSEIAARAGVDKQLISYYFGGKRGLYQALFERWLAEEQELADPELPLDQLVVRYLEDQIAQREMHRLFIRESIDDATNADDQPPEVSAAELADMRRRQENGEIADDIDPAYLLLALQGAVGVGVTIPGDVRRLTGLDPSSTEFADAYGQQLRRIVLRLRE